MTDKKQSLQALRAIAFVGIFLTHSNIVPGLGSWGTSVFFVLSGFLMAYNYKFRIDEREVSLSYCFRFGIKRILKIYPLHVLVTVASVPLEFILGNASFENVGSLIPNFFLHLFLLHSWVPSTDYYFSLNSLDWYLSVSLFLYMVFPFLIISARNDSKSKRIIKAITVFILMFLCILLANLLIPDNFSLKVYFSYIFPVLRLGDFYLGMILGLFVSEGKIKKPSINIHLIEVVVILFTIISIIYSNMEHSNPISSAVATTTILYLPTSLALVYVFFLNEGLITKILTNRITVFIGDHSTYGYLIHQKVISYVMVGMFFVLNMANDFIVALVSIVIMFLLIYAYKVLEKKFFHKNNSRNQKSSKYV